MAVRSFRVLCALAAIVLLSSVCSAKRHRRNQQQEKRDLISNDLIRAAFEAPDWPSFLATFYPESNMQRRHFSLKRPHHKGHQRQRRRQQRKKALKKAAAAAGQRRSSWRPLKSLNRRRNRKSFKTRSRFQQQDSDDDVTVKASDVIGPRVAPLRSANSRRQRTGSERTGESKPVFNNRKRKPNVILMMADDQDVELGSLQFMPKLNKYLRSEGAHMENGYVTTPMCCPSRSSMLTGLYAHNHHVLTNNENCSSSHWVQNHESRTFATYMHDAGYKTGYFGKYLNKYAGNHIPSGWDEWFGLIRNSRFYNYTLNVNGQKVKHGWDYKRDYFPDLITNDSLAFLRQAKQHDPDQPVLMVMSYPGPHGPEDSAPQYQDLFFNVTTHHTPAYDYAPNPDKQWILQVTDRMEPIQKKFTDVLMTKRLQTLQSIDEGIERLYNELESLGELDNTYVFYTSDHGYHLGQFGLVKGKAFPFDVDTKVPFFVRGPGIEPGTVGLQPVLNIDLAPTFLDIAGVSVPLHMDGKSILPTLLPDDKLSDSEKQVKSGWRDSFLLERGKMTVARYQKIRHSMPPEASNTTPWEAAEAAAAAAAAEAEKAKNEVLSGGRLGTTDLLLEKPRLTKQERLAVECLKPRFRAPCSTFQRRKCVRKKSGDWKIVRCRNYALQLSSAFDDFLDEEDDEDEKADDDEEEEEECRCPDQPPEVTSAGNLARTERKLQRKFLKKHTNGGKGRQQRKLRHKFLKLDAENRFFDDNMQQSSGLWSQRWRRSATALTQPPSESSVSSVLKEIAEEEIDEVDIIMEDIHEEIADLEQSITGGNVTAGKSKPVHDDDVISDDVSGSSSSSSESKSVESEMMPACEISRETRNVNCSSDVFTTPSRLRNSRAYVNEQIRRLRAQLFELKEIRKHLKRKQPTYQEVDEDDDDKEEDTDATRMASFGVTTPDAKLPRQSKSGSTCACPSNNKQKTAERQRQQLQRQRMKDARRSRRQRIKVERLRRRLRRKERRQLKKARKARKERRKKKHDACLVDDEKMNCFTHNNEHWKTKPLWNGGSFCACTNSNTNTYWCVRTINITHNYLYCEFVSGIITYYDLNVDPYQLRNIYQTLSDGELNYMHGQLLDLKEYAGFDGKWRPAKVESPRSRTRSLLHKNSNRRMSAAISRQRQFAKRYGQILPALEAFKSKKFKNRHPNGTRSLHRNNSKNKKNNHRNHKQQADQTTWVAMLIRFNSPHRH